MSRRGADGIQPLRAVERQQADGLGARIPQGVPEAGRDEREIAADEAMDPSAEVEQELARQHVERLLERVDMRGEPAPGRQPDDGESVWTAP